jgi:hypothetical protein
MARKRKRNPLSERLSRLRYRAKAALQQLSYEATKIKGSKIPGRKTRRQQDIEQRQAQIEQLMSETYLGRGANADKTRAARKAGEELRHAISKTEEKRTAAAQRRANEIALEQLAVERRGGASEIWGGRLGRMRGEQIFWASTRDIWTGADPKDRMKAVMDALGTDSIEEAFDLVLSQSSEAITAAMDAADGDFADAAAYDARDSDIWIAFVSSFYVGSDGSLHIARR